MDDSVTKAADQRLIARDNFAAQAMAAALQGANIPPESWDEILPTVARFAFKMADEMLKARDI